MGTNYYLHSKPRPHCGRSDDRRHIGKSSSGWCFSLRVYPEDNIHDLDDWRELLKTGEIWDEYGDRVSIDDMLERIEKRAHPIAWDDKQWNRQLFGYHDETDFHRKNHSERGPNNLLRHYVDGRHCIKQGAGTWDCIVGDFS